MVSGGRTAWVAGVGAWGVETRGRGSVRRMRERRENVGLQEREAGRSRELIRGVGKAKVGKGRRKGCNC